MPRSALLGKTDHDFWPPEQVEHFIRKDRETLAGGKLLEIDEEPIQTARGLRWLRTKKIPLRDSTGVPRFLLGISEDITEQKQVYEELQRTRGELEQRVIDRTAQPDSDLVSPAVDRQVRELLRRDDVAVSSPPARDGHRDDRLGVGRRRLPYPDSYCAALRSERRS